MIRTGIIGFGLAGAFFHAPVIGAVDRLLLVAASTSRPENVPEGVAVRAAEEIIADPDIDLVVIATPNESHHPLAKAALLAGKHVVVDKPFTVTAAEGEELIALAAEAGRVLTVFHNRRWDGDFVTVRHLLESGALGKIMLYEAHWDRFRPEIMQSWRQRPGVGAGLLNDLGPHLIDQALLLFGMPDALTADIAAQRGGEVEDYFTLTFHYGSMRAVLSSSTLVAEPRPRFALHGTGGSFVKYGLDPQEASLKAGASPRDNGFGEDDPAFHGTFTRANGGRERVATERGRYVHFYKAVAAAILDGAPAPVDPMDAVRGLKLIELARQSAREGKRVTC